MFHARGPAAAKDRSPSDDVVRGTATVLDAADLRPGLRSAACQVNMGEPAPKVYNSYSALGISITTAVCPIPSNHFPPFTTIHSITQFYVQIIHILVHNLFPGFTGPSSLSDSLNIQSNTLSPNHHHRFLKHVHIITMYFFVSLYVFYY